MISEWTRCEEEPTHISLCAKMLSSLVYRFIVYNAYLYKEKKASVRSFPSHFATAYLPALSVDHPMNLIKPSFT